MILSKYNKFFRVSDKWVVYNSASASMFELEDELYEQLINSDFSKIQADYLDDLFKQYILVENDDAVFNKFKFEIYKNRYSSQNMHLTLIPTYYCNFNCTYCYEKSRPNIFMSEEIQKNIIAFVKEKKPDFLHVTWYGGEPLLAFDKIISLTQALRKLVVKFSASIVSNGYALTMEKIKQFDKLHIEEAQITLDGPAEIHNKKRPLLNGKETFDKILKNIDNLINNSNTQLQIRVNLDKENSSEFYKLQEYLYNRYNNRNIFVYPALIQNFENNSSCKSAKSCLFNKDEYNHFLLDQFHTHKNTKINFFPSPPDLECMAKHLNAFIIGADGNIYKCWLDIGNNSKSIGNINNTTCNYDLLAKYMVDFDVFEDEKCKNCVLLPSCGGGCAYERLKHKYEDSETDYCSPMLKNLDDFLKIQYLIDTQKES